MTDRGTAFTSRKLESFLKKYTISHRQVAVASPWANGLAERVNRFLRSSLAKLSESAHTWSEPLSTVQYVINNTVHLALKSSPSKILLGYDQRNHTDRELKELVTEIAKIDSDLLKERETKRKESELVTQHLRQYNKLKYDQRHRKPTAYKTGEYVLIRDLQSKAGVSKKLKPNYKGPYVIDKVLNNNRYVVKDIPGFNITARPYNAILSPDKIKPWIKLV